MITRLAKAISPLFCKRLSYVFGKGLTGQLGFNLNNQLQLLEHQETMMKVSQENLRQLSPQELEKNYFVQNYFSQYTEQLLFFEHKHKQLDDKTVNYPRNCYVRVDLPLSIIHSLNASFKRLNTNYVRTGRIFELIDQLAFEVAHRFLYLDTSVRQSRLLTQCTDNIQLFQRLQLSKNITIQCYPTYSYKNKLEVQFDLMQGNQLAMTGTEVLVNQTGLPLPDLKFRGEENEKICYLRYEIGQENQAVRQQKKIKSLEQMPPSADERVLLHDFFINSSKYKAENNHIVIGTTRKQKSEVMHNQDKNIEGVIFGGILTRKAIDISWLAAYLHVRAKCSPFLYHIDDFNFIHPIKVGSIAHLEAVIGFVHKNIMHLVIECSEITPENKKVKCSEFHFSYLAPGLDNLPKVYPETYDEGMTYLDSRRRVLPIID